MTSEEGVESIYRMRRKVKRVAVVALGGGGSSRGTSFHTAWIDLGSRKQARVAYVRNDTSGMDTVYCAWKVA